MIDIPDFVYAKDSRGNALCPRCRNLVPQCVCPTIEPVKPKQPPVRPHFRIEKSGRQGKVVTIIEALPGNEPWLRDVLKTLKARSGSGGTYYLNSGAGTIELQGDHRKSAGDFFRALNER